MDVRKILGKIRNIITHDIFPLFVIEIFGLVIIFSSFFVMTNFILGHEVRGWPYNYVHMSFSTAVLFFITGISIFILADKNK